MDSLSVAGLSKCFGRVVAVDNVTFSVKQGQIVALLGPSGCGKTTTLRLVAGFETPDGGDIRIEGRPMRGLRPYERNIGLLFQSYALFPHMTVEQNIAFGLRHRGAGRAEVIRAVAAMLELVRLQGYEKRRPDELSGGQQQRVALARALAVKPHIMLLDEPLSALDAKLRLELRFELKKILTDVGATTVVVTHDQDEAMGLADHVVVMNAGRIIQQGSPTEIYGRPRSRFVAEFVGRSNWFRGRLGAEREKGIYAFAIAGGPEIYVSTPTGRVAGSEAEVCIRPERIQMQCVDPASGVRLGANVLRGILRDIAPLGADISFLVELPFGTRVEVVDKNTGQNPYKPGDLVALQFLSEDCIVMEETMDYASRGQRNGRGGPGAPRPGIGESGG
jgi:putative spermidine/putrescine transport system ATP-binding protein/putrescine transport system ATP-binding protein